MENDYKFIEYCRLLKGATEDIKWETNHVFSIGGKMFASFYAPDPAGAPFGFKTDPEEYEALIQFPGIEPAPYLARAHWVSLVDHATLPEDEILDLQAEAHRIVASKLSRKKREILGIKS